MHAKHSICLFSMSGADKALVEEAAPKQWLNTTELYSIPIFLIKPSSPTFSSPPLPFFSSKSQPPLMFGVQKPEQDLQTGWLHCPLERLKWGGPGLGKTPFPPQSSISLANSYTSFQAHLKHCLLCESFPDLPRQIWGWGGECIYQNYNGN